MPATIKLHSVEQGSPEWHAAREDMYTGSNADKLLLEDSPLKVVDGKVTKYAQAGKSVFGGNFYTKRGHLLEDKAIELYDQIYNTKTDRPGYVTNSDYPGCLYSPDGIDGDYLIEVKCFMERMHLQIFDGYISVKILAQIHYGMLITGKKKARLIIYNPRFAKTHIQGDYGGLMDNPNYDPKKAFKAIDISFDKEIANNFKKKLRG